MLRRSPRHTFEAIASQAVALSVTLAGSDLRRCVTKRAQSKALSRARGGSADQKSCGGEVGHRNESPEFTTQVSLVGVSHKSKHRMTEAGWLNRGVERQL
jgi:hypothetical protein